MAARDRTTVEVTCPCCGAKLTIDPTDAEVLLSRQPQKPTPHRDLDHAAQLLQRDRAHRDALFHQSVADEKAKSSLLERKFEEALKRTRNESPTPPVRDIDLD